MVGVFKLTRNTIKRKFIYNDYRIVFGGAGSLSVGNLFTWNVWYFGVDDSLSRQPENRKNYFLIVGEESTYDVNDTVGESEKRFSTVFTLLQNSNINGTCITMIMKAICMSIKQKFVNLRVLIIYLLTIFSQEVYPNILQTMKWVKLH